MPPPASSTTVTTAVSAGARSRRGRNNASPVTHRSAAGTPHAGQSGEAQDGAASPTNGLNGSSYTTTNADAAGAKFGLSTPAANSSRATAELAPKPHFPSKAPRRSSVPSSDMADSPSTTGMLDQALQPNMFDFSSLDMSRSNTGMPAGFNPLSMDHQSNGSSTMYGRASTVNLGAGDPRNVMMPSLNPMPPPFGHLPNRSNSLHTVQSSPGLNRQLGPSARSFSTPGIPRLGGGGGGPPSTSSPVDESPSQAPDGSNSAAAIAASLRGHSRHPSNSTSSVGPNVAGRIGVGGNVMVDPHGPPGGQKSGNSGAGAFVYKVYNMLLDPSFQHLIAFNANGQSFTVSNVTDFSKTVLPKHFKHNNFSSFVRQLNMYGFHKVNKTPRGQRGQENTGAWEFVHPKFLRGRPDLLDQIRRKPLETEQPRKENSPALSALQMQQRLMGYAPDGQPFSGAPASGGPGPSAAGGAGGPPAGPSHPHPNFRMSPESPMGGPPPHAFLPAPPMMPGPPSGMPGPAPVPQPPPPHLFGPPPSMPPGSGSAGSVDPIEALTSVQGEVLGRLHGVQDGYEALYRELYETRRRQEVLIELASHMYRTLQALTNGNVPFPFPGNELFHGAHEESGPPIFRITEPDPDNGVIHVDPRTQQAVSLSNSPSNSEFAFNGPSRGNDRRVSIDPSTFGAFGNLVLSSHPTSPALIGPGDGTTAPFGTEFAENGQGSGFGGGPGGLHLSTDGLLAPGPSAPPLSPGSAFSTAIQTPLPPSPSPFQQGKFGHSMVGLGMDLTSNGGAAANGSGAGGSMDPALFMHTSPMGNSYYDAEVGGDRSGASGTLDDGSPMSSFTGAGESSTARSSSRRGSGGSSENNFSEGLDMATLMNGPGSLAYQSSATGKGKKRPATGSMDLNMQPARA